MKKVLIAIPALNPSTLLIEYIDRLIENNFDSILVVDDGSRSEFNHIFQEIATRKECSIFRHALNLGKGRGMKNSINHFLNMENSMEYAGVIFVDSDGQHEIDDVMKVRDAMVANPDKLYFGSRDFNESHVPPKSRFGNKTTTILFWLFYGKKIRDTQTGLRGIPSAIAPLFIDLKGERFEYEMNMLISAVMNDVAVEEVGINTVYFDNNSETHFRPVQDSLRIMSLLFANFLKYILSSLSSFFIDILLFQLFILLWSDFEVASKIMLATLAARVGSSVVNYWLNKNFVFQNEEKDPRLFIGYFSLVAVQLLASGFLVNFFHQSTGVSETIVKIVVDGLLFLVSYRIQKLYIFKQTYQEKEAVYLIEEEDIQ